MNNVLEFKPIQEENFNCNCKYSFFIEGLMHILATDRQDADSIMEDLRAIAKACICFKGGNNE